MDIVKDLTERDNRLFEVITKKAFLTDADLEYLIQEKQVDYEPYFTTLARNGFEPRHVVIELNGHYFMVDYDKNIDGKEPDLYWDDCFYEVELKEKIVENVKTTYWTKKEN